jgi:hypothetical protein
VTITLPDPGQRFMAMQLISQDHYTWPAAYAPNVRTITRQEIGTRYVLVGIRTLVDPADPADMKKAHVLQDAIKAEQPGGPGTFEVPNWDPVSQKKVRDALLILATTIVDTSKSFGLKDEVDPVQRLIGAASAWGRQSAKGRDISERHGFDAWRAYADVFRGELLARRGELDSGLALLHTGVGKLRDAKFVQYQTAFLLMLAQSLARAGRLEEGRAALDEALQQCERTDERWCMSELLRVRGEIALLEPTPDRAAAERDFEAALVLARRQQALSWELRSAISLARLRRKEGRTAEARSLLAPVSGRFTEGFGTADLRAANGLLTELA